MMSERERGDTVNVLGQFHVAQDVVRKGPSMSSKNPTGDRSKDDLYEDQIPPANAQGVDGNEPGEGDGDGIDHGKAADAHVTEPPAETPVEASPEAPASEVPDGNAPND